MFDTLSSEQEQLLDQLSERMRVDAMPDQSCTDEFVLGALTRIYASLGLKTPHLVWADGPFELAVMPLLLQLLCFRHENKKLDDLNIDGRIERLTALLTQPAWHSALKNLLAQTSATTICSLKYEDDPPLTAFNELQERFSWSRCGLPTGGILSNLLQQKKNEVVTCLSKAATLALSTELTSRLYTRPIDAAQAVKRTVGLAVLQDQSLSLRDSAMTVFGSAKGSMSSLYRRAQELHEQIAGTTFETELESCRAPQADSRFRKPRLLENDAVLNTAGLFAFGPYDVLWGAWASYSASCYAIIADMLRDQFPKEVRAALSDLSLLMRCGFAYTPLSRTFFICKFPRVSLDEQNRLHGENRAAIEFQDGYKIYAWRGVTVPGDLIENPHHLTSKRIDAERNVEIRRALIDKFGIANYLQETGAGIRDQTELGTLYLKQLPGDEPIAIVRVKNSTAESDGTFKEYFLRVPPTMKTVKEALAWTFYLKPEDYEPELET